MHKRHPSASGNLRFLKNPGHFFLITTATNPLNNLSHSLAQTKTHSRGKSQPVKDLHPLSGVDSGYTFLYSDGCPGYSGNKSMTFTGWDGKPPGGCGPKDNSRSEE